MDLLISAVSPELQYMGVKLLNPNGFKVCRGENYVVIGENGCGKSLLAEIITCGWNVATNVIKGDRKNLNIKKIEFSDIHSLTGISGGYYQQRFESSSNDGIPTVRQLVEGTICEEQWNELCSDLSLTDILDKRVNYLSSGELRKFLIIRLFSEIPDVLILDNPYIGLDEASRDLLNGLLERLKTKGTSVILLLCNPNDIPPFTDVVVPMKNMLIGKPQTYDGSESQMNEIKSLFDKKFNLDKLPEIKAPEVNYTTAFELRNCEVKYGDKIILKDISWRVDAGEKWALLGENGAGKSMLLSLVYADNPQGYSNDISLFDHKRGTGESIWDIKKRIAYISPEMHLYFNAGEKVLNIVALGLRDNVGCYVTPKEEEKQLAMQWLETFGLGSFADRQFRTLSSGEQRLVLLARTFIRSASLIILDEPLHGLDVTRKAMIAELIRRRTLLSGVSMVYVTHYRNEIPEMCNNIFNLKKYRRN